MHDVAPIHESNRRTGWVRVLALVGAVLLACPSHPGSAAIVPPEVPTPAHIAALLNLNIFPPNPGYGRLFDEATWSISSASSGATLDEGGIVTPQQSGNFFDFFADLVSLDLTPNRRFKVKLVADVGVANGFTNGGIGSGRASVDPVFSFAPSVGPEYSFVFSEGVGNLPIPEPQTVTLMAAGLLILIVITERLRSRR